MWRFILASAVMERLELEIGNWKTEMIAWHEHVAGFFKPAIWTGVEALGMWRLERCKFDGARGALMVASRPIRL